MDSKHLAKKVVLLGDSAVGKTSLVRRYVIDAFEDKYIATIGTKVMKKDIEYKLPGRTIFLTMMIWDILGQREFRSVRAVGLRGADAAILVGDLTRPDTISAIAEFWYPQVKAIEGEVPAVVIGNKADIATDGEEEKALLETIASEVSGLSFICSAKTGENVERAFFSMGELLIGGHMGTVSIPETEEEISIIRAVDFVMSDFCEQYGDITKGMETAEKIFIKVRLDINAPRSDLILEAIELMSEIEKDRLGREIAEINKLRRWKMVEDAEHQAVPSTG